MDLGCSHVRWARTAEGLGNTLKTVVVNNGMIEGNCDDRKMGAATPGSDACGRQVYTNAQGKSDRCIEEVASDGWISHTALVIENGNDDLVNNTV